MKPVYNDHFIRYSLSSKAHPGGPGPPGWALEDRGSDRMRGYLPLFASITSLNEQQVIDCIIKVVVIDRFHCINTYRLALRLLCHNKHRSFNMLSSHTFNGTPKGVPSRHGIDRGNGFVVSYGDWPQCVVFSHSWWYGRPLWPHNGQPHFFLFRVTLPSITMLVWSFNIAWCYAKHQILSLPWVLTHVKWQLN